jgi:hypothetical protein
MNVLYQFLLINAFICTVVYKQRAPFLCDSFTIIVAFMIVWLESTTSLGLIVALYLLPLYSGSYLIQPSMFQ